MSNDSFLGQTGTAAEQSSVWGLETTSPQNPIALFNGPVNDVSADWTLAMRVPEGTFLELTEALLFNGDAGDVNFRIAICKPADAAPSGASLDQPRVVRACTLATGTSKRWRFTTGLPSGWKIYLYTDAAADVNANVVLSGIMVSHLS